jgi:hypothetical protein
MISEVDEGRYFRQYFHKKTRQVVEKTIRPVPERAARDPPLCPYPNRSKCHTNNQAVAKRWFMALIKLTLEPGMVKDPKGDWEGGNTQIRE